MEFHAKGHRRAIRICTICLAIIDSCFVRWLSDHERRLSGLKLNDESQAVEQRRDAHAHRAPQVTTNQPPANTKTSPRHFFRSRYSPKYNARSSQCHTCILGGYSLLQTPKKTTHRPPLYINPQSLWQLMHGYTDPVLPETSLQRYIPPVVAFS